MDCFSYMEFFTELLLPPTVCSESSFLQKALLDQFLHAVAVSLPEKTFEKVIATINYFLFLIERSPDSMCLYFSLFPISIPEPVI